MDRVLPLLEAFLVASQGAVHQDVQLHESLAEETLIGRRTDQETRRLKSRRLHQSHDFERLTTPERHLSVQLDVLSLVDSRVDGSDATWRRRRGCVLRLASGVWRMRMKFCPALRRKMGCCGRIASETA